MKLDREIFVKDIAVSSVRTLEVIVDFLLDVWDMSCVTLALFVILFTGYRMGLIYPEQMKQIWDTQTVSLGDAFRILMPLGGIFLGCSLLGYLPKMVWEMLKGLSGDKRPTPTP